MAAKMRFKRFINSILRSHEIHESEGEVLFYKR